MNIQIAKTDPAIQACFAAFSELRPHLSADTFLSQVKRQMNNHGYTLIYIADNEQVVAAAGFRVAEFLAWGKTLYLDDLITASTARRNGYGGILLDWLLKEAENQGCAQFHLDSGPQRNDAHRLYLNKKLLISSLHFSKEVD